MGPATTARFWGPLQNLPVVVGTRLELIHKTFSAKWVVSHNFTVYVYGEFVFYVLSSLENLSFYTPELYFQD